MDQKALTKTQLFAWLDQVLSRDIPSHTFGFHFNLYEDLESVHVQLVGTGSFVVEPTYWPGEETFTTGEDVFVVPFSVAGATWQEWLKSIQTLLSEYLERGEQATVLRRFQGVGLGFVDGDMHVLLSSDQAQS